MLVCTCRNRLGEFHQSMPSALSGTLMDMLATRRLRKCWYNVWVEKSKSSAAFPKNDVDLCGKNLATHLRRRLVASPASCTSSMLLAERSGNGLVEIRAPSLLSPRSCDSLADASETYGASCIKKRNKCCMELARVRVPRPGLALALQMSILRQRTLIQRKKDRNHQIERSATQSWVAPSLVYLLFLHLYKEKCHYLRRGLRDAARNGKRRSSSSETCPSTSASADSTSGSIPLRFRADPYGLRDRMTDTFVVTCSVCQSTVS